MPASPRSMKTTRSRPGQARRTKAGSRSRAASTPASATTNVSSMRSTSGTRRACHEEVAFRPERPTGWEEGAAAVREYTVPDDVEVDPSANIADAVFENADTEPDRVAFLRKVDDRWTEVTARQFRDDVQSLAKGLVAAGVKAGERVGLLSRTRYEWTLADYAIWTAGCITVPIYETSSPEQVAWILGDSSATALIVETDAHRKTFEEVSGELRDVRQVWGIDAGDITDLMGTGSEVTDDEITQRR